MTILLASALDCKLVTFGTSLTLSFKYFSVHTQRRLRISVSCHSEIVSPPFVSITKRRIAGVQQKKECGTRQNVKGFDYCFLINLFHFIYGLTKTYHSYDEWWVCDGTNKSFLFFLSSRIGINVDENSCNWLWTVCCILFYSLLSDNKIYFYVFEIKKKTIYLCWHLTQQCNFYICVEFFNKPQLKLKLITLLAFI